jgi:hypothetical protein
MMPGMPLLYLAACLFTLAHGQNTLLGSKAAPIPTTINHIDTPIDLREWIRHPPRRSSHRVIQLAKKKPTSPPPLPAPPIPTPPTPPPLKHSLATLIAQVQGQLAQARSSLYQDATQINRQVSKNDENRKIQSTKASLLTHAASDFLSEKGHNDQHMKDVLSQRHIDRSIPCGKDPTTPCSTLQKLSSNLRAKKNAMSDADTCDELSHTSCSRCTVLTFCGWCAAERTCLEGNAAAPRFGEPCAASWYHQDQTNHKCSALDYPNPLYATNPNVLYHPSTNSIVPEESALDYTNPLYATNPNVLSHPSTNSIVPEEPMDIPNVLFNVFDPSCIHFSGSPGECERSKLQLESIYTRCLAEGRTAVECDTVKATEAHRMAIEQSTKGTQRDSRIKSIETSKAKEELAKCLENVKQQNNKRKQKEHEEVSRVLQVNEQGTMEFIETQRLAMNKECVDRYR